MKVFRHNHEVENGRTSSVTQHMLGFSASGDILNYARGSSRLASPARYVHGGLIAEQHLA